MRTAGLLTIVATMAVAGCSQPAAAVRPPAVVLPLGSPSAPSTSRSDLERAVQEMDARLVASPTDAAAAIRLADALLRQARAFGNSGLAIRAERVLMTVLARDPDRYDARRLLAAALLSQHRFPEAVREAERCLQIKHNDPWAWGVIGDGRLELGDRDGAFAAFDRMVALRPDAASYARIAYARELQGDLGEATRVMTMALEATSPNDPEALAWHHVQLGSLHRARDRFGAARRAYAHALHLFPDHPAAVEGLARVAFARQRYGEALSLVEPLLARSATPDALALSAGILRAMGRTAEATLREALAEAARRETR